MGLERQGFRQPQPLSGEEVQEQASALLQQFDQAFEEAGDLETADLEKPEGFDLKRGDTTWFISRQSTSDSETLLISFTRRTEKARSHGESTLKIRASEQSTALPTAQHKSSWDIKPHGDGANSETTPNTKRAIDNTKALLVQFREG